MTELPFAKMQGLGNDFVVIDAIAQPDIALTQKQIRLLANRRLGIGADQVLLLSRGDGDEFSYRIWNADGNEVSQCGNGARAAHMLLSQRGYVKGSSKLRTQVDLLEIHSGKRGPRAFLGEPNFKPEAIPLARPEQQESYAFTNCGLSTNFAALALGNPHALFWVDDVTTAPVVAVGAHLNDATSDFPEGVNVGFATVPADGKLSLRVYERGVAETPACGSGAAACAAIVFIEHALEQVEIAMPGGSLLAGWSGPGNGAWIEGEVGHVFDGIFQLASD